MAPGGGFMERIFKTSTFRLFMRYLAEALVLGTVLCRISVPFMVYDIKNLPRTTAAFKWGAGIWAFVAVAAFLSFYRVVSVFLIWVRASSSFRRRPAQAQA
jgi:hypothetical protein